MNDVRAYLSKLVDERGLKLKSLSQAIGRNDAYLQQFIARGVPVSLSPKDRAKLAQELDVDEAHLGGTSYVNRPHATVEQDSTVIPQFDVRASAGGGSVVDQEAEIGRWHVPTAFVHQLVGTRASGLTIIEVAGDSMEPTLRSGDTLMIDSNDQDVSQPGIFALYDGSRTVVKRIEKILAKPEGRLRLSSDNPMHKAYDVPVDEVRVAGRAVWYGRRI